MPMDGRALGQDTLSGGAGAFWKELLHAATYCDTHEQETPKFSSSSSYSSMEQSRRYGRDFLRDVDNHHDDMAELRLKLRARTAFWTGIERDLKSTGLLPALDYQGENL